MGRTVSRRQPLWSVSIALAAHCCLLLVANAAAPELRLSNGEGLEPSSDLFLASDAEVQGVVAAFDWDGALFSALDLEASSVLAEADLVVRRVEPSFMVLGVVLDTDGSGGEVIPPGDRAIATARFRCKAPSPSREVSSLLEFRDGKYGTGQLGPALDNLITVGGQTISIREGLRLVNGKLSCPAIASGTLRIRSVSLPPGTRCGSGDVLLDTPSRIQGFALAISHDPAVVVLQDISVVGTETEASRADFVSPKVFAGGGTLGVVLDLQPPFEGNTLPIGNGLVIAKFNYCCKLDPPAGGPDTTSALRFVDGQLGEPLIDNILVVGGQSVTPSRLENGTFTCRAPGESQGQEFRCGGPLDPKTGELPPVVGEPGSTVEVSFYYRSPPKETEGDTGEDQIQGLSMAVCFDPTYVQCLEGSLSIQGTITNDIGAEFVNHHCESTTEDGDPGELVIGILVDALPPFDGHTLPPTDSLLKLFGVSFRIADNAPCNRCVPIEFCDGADGRGQVPTRNLISVNNFAVRPQFFNCEICVQAKPVFQRGDCNFSQGGPLAVDIADPAAVISYLFLRGGDQFKPSCLDACDANDDGRVDFADPVFILTYLFRHGAKPPLPGPDAPGTDPSADKLGCERGSVCP